MLTRVALLLLCCATQAAGSEPGTAELEAQARALAGEFVQQIRPLLQQAMAEGGPSLAIEVCASTAPRIADALSADSGWQVRRVSLQPRNASRAQPDDWERAVLEDFDRRQAAGAEAATLTRAEVIGERFRFMQAQTVEPLCLTCHGSELAEPVRATLDVFYPDDEGTGYRPGQVRGAISLARQR